MQYRLLIQFELEDQTDTLEALLWENAVSTYSNAIWLQIFMLYLNIVFIDFFCCNAKHDAFSAFD